MAGGEAGEESIGRVTAVVVTCRRPALLARCLDALMAQTRRPERILVVDNGDDADTAGLDWARWPLAEHRRTGRNLGGAGGFAAGMAAAEVGSDWLWLLDDDSICEPEALQALEAAILAEPEPPVLAASRVRWTDGRPHPMNLVAPRYGDDPEAFHAAVERRVFPIRAATFVSCLLRADRVRAEGYPIADYFLWHDDIEYTNRLLRRHHGVAVPTSIVVHETARPYGTLEAAPARFRLAVRNQLWTVRRSPGLSGFERLRAFLYCGFVIGRYLARRPLQPGAWSAVATGIAQACLGLPAQDRHGRPPPVLPSA